MREAMMLSCVENESLEHPDKVHHYLRRQFPEHEVRERERFVFRREFAELIHEHHKCTTIRYTKGALEYPARSVLPVFVVAEKSSCEQGLSFEGCVEVNIVCYKRFESLSANDAKLDGFETVDDLKNTLSQIYGTIQNDEIVSIFGIKAQEGYRFRQDDHLR